MRDDTANKTISNFELSKYVYEYFLKNSFENSKKLVNNLMDLFDDEFRKQKKEFLKEHKVDFKLGIKFSIHQLPDAVKLEKVYNDFLEKSPETILIDAKKYDADIKEFKKQSKIYKTIASLRYTTLYPDNINLINSDELKKYNQELKNMNTNEFNKENKKHYMEAIKYNETKLKQALEKKNKSLKNQIKIK